MWMTNTITHLFRSINHKTPTFAEPPCEMSPKGDIFLCGCGLHAPFRIAAEECQGSYSFATCLKSTICDQLWRGGWTRTSRTILVINFQPYQIVKRTDSIRTYIAWTELITEKALNLWSNTKSVAREQNTWNRLELNMRLKRECYSTGI